MCACIAGCAPNAFPPGRGTCRNTFSTCHWLDINATNTELFYGTSGATKQLLERWAHEAEPAIVFTGYRAPDTPADCLIKNGRAQFLRWNVHPRLSDVVALAEAVRPQTIIPAFCDRAQLPGLAAALAPAHVTMDGPIEL